MNTYPSHALGPFQHRVGIDQFGTVPVLFQDSPATFQRIVFAMVRRIVQEADGFADVIGKLDNSLEELRAPTIVFRPVIGLDLELCGAIPHLGRLTRPPRVEAVDDEIAGLGRTSEGPVEVSTVFIDDTKRGVFFLASHIVIRRLVVGPCLAPSRVLANIHRRLAVHAHAHDGFALACSVMRLDIGEDGVGFGDFFGVWLGSPDAAGSRCGSTLPTCSYVKATHHPQVPAHATA